MKLPKYSELAVLFEDEKACVKYLYIRGCFYQSISCGRCGSVAHAQLSQMRFRCGRKGCRSEISLKANTFFQSTHLKCHQILRFGYLWLNRNSQTQIMNEMGLSSATVTLFLGHFRQLVSSTLGGEEESMIGGDGVTVEIDETKLGKRKYHRGHRVDGVWVLVGVERGGNRDVFLEEVQDRSQATLEEVIRRRVRPDSTIITDLWKGYSGLSENLGFNHLTVNHSLYFRDPHTGANTNTVEGTNNTLKIMIRPRNRTRDIQEHLGEFVWRRKHSHNLWEAFLDAIKDIHYDK